MTAGSSPPAGSSMPILPGLAVRVGAPCHEVAAGFDQEIKSPSLFEPAAAQRRASPLPIPPRSIGCSDSHPAPSDPLDDVVRSAADSDLRTRIVESRAAVAQSIEIAQDARVELTGGDAPGAIGRNERPSQAWGRSLDGEGACLPI